jgi:hypothetical protein
LCDPWWAPYTGAQATGDHVLALWQFDSGDGTADDSGHGHRLTFEGGQLAAAGRFGKALESFCGWPVADQRHRAVTPRTPELSPAGAFTLELWLKPKPELDDKYPDAFLLDKKYVSPTDYQLILGAPDRSGTRALHACLGFGQDSSTWYSKPARFAPGVWRHVAFAYDGAGTGAFFLDGLPWGSTFVAGRAAVRAGTHPLSIGDRLGSYYHGFPGSIDQVRICRGLREFRRARCERISDRSCFVRMERPAMLQFRLTNLQPSRWQQAQVAFSLDGQAVLQRPLSGIDAGQSQVIEFPLDTRLRPDAYRLTAHIRVRQPDPFDSDEELTVRIVPRKTPHEFPVVMWGGVSGEFERLQQIGFTHALGLAVDYAQIWQAGKPTAAAKPEAVQQTRQLLDDALAAGLRVSASLSPASYLRDKPEFCRVDRAGKPRSGQADVCGLAPAVAPFCRNVGASVAQTYGHFPAFDSALLHTEVRDHAAPCFHPHDAAAFRRAAGIDIPAEVSSPRGVHYSRLPNFPATRVIPEDHPLYVYYRWYWKAGDGWNALNTALHEGLKSTGRQDLWTWHDPAVRVARVYGSGGATDVLSQWTYSYPDPIRIGLATDELLAMTAGAPAKQQVMKMTQIIWYRSQTAPAPNAKQPATGSKKPAAGSKQPAAPPPTYQARWEREQPDAPFITIAPLHLREAFWTKLARSIQGIMYHGWQSLVPCPGTGGYRYTHPQTQHELARLIREVARPLGPALRQVPEAPHDVAFLESFAAEMFAGRGTFGWGGGWAGDAYHVLQYAHVQPEIVFDETVVARELSPYRVLVMPDCDVITQPMARRIQTFQAAGGLIVGDERLTPAIKPDIRLTSYQRTGRADQDKAALVARAAELCQQLDARYRRYVDSSHPEVIPYRRRFGTADYVFVVNDRREFGRYVGHHGLVMENGLPADATLKVARPEGFVYDLVESRPIATRTVDKHLTFDVQLGPCDGRVLLIAARPVDRVEISAPATAALGDQAKCLMRVVDAAGQPVDAVIPLQVTVRDADGATAEFSGYYGAAGGKLELTLDVAPNDVAGNWQIEVRELASGRRASHSLLVRGAADGQPPRSVPSGAANPVQPNG